MKLRLASILAAGALCAALAATAAAAEPAKPEEDPNSQVLKAKDLVRNGLIKERVEAVQTLGKITDQGRLQQFEIGAFLVNVVADKGYPPRVREAAVAALASVVKFDPPVKDKLMGPFVARLGDKTEAQTVRRALAEALGVMLTDGKPADDIGFAALEKVARDRQEEGALGAAALIALGKAGRAQSINLVVAAIRDAAAPQDVKTAAVQALGLMLPQIRVKESPDLVQVLANLLADEKLPVEPRVIAAKTLAAAISSGAASVQQVAAPLAAAIEKATDPVLAKGLVEAMAYTPDPAAIAALGKAYAVFSNVSGGEPYKQVRKAIAQALGEYFHPLAREGRHPVGQTAAKLLVDVLKKEPDGDVKAAAVFSLGGMYDPKYDRSEAAAELLEALAAKGSSEELKAEAKDSLEQICGTSRADAEAWTQWLKDNKGKLLPR